MSDPYRTNAPVDLPKPRREWYVDGPDDPPVAGITFMVMVLWFFFVLLVFTLSGPTPGVLRGFGVGIFFVLVWCAAWLRRRDVKEP